MHSELRETMLKELNVSMTTMNQQIGILNEEMKMIKKNHMVILKLKHITKMRNSLQELKNRF